MAGTSASAGWGPASWSRRNNSAGFKAINKFLLFLENWKLWPPPSRRLSNEGRRRKVGHARAATFNGKSGNPSSSISRANGLECHKRHMTSVKDDTLQKYCYWRESPLYATMCPMPELVQQWEPRTTVSYPIKLHLRYDVM